MVTAIKVTGLKEVRKFINKLSPKLKEKVGKKGILKLAENLRGRIRRRFTLAGYGKGASSGKGFKSIIAKPTGKGAIVKIGVGAPWVVLLEEGVKSHWVSPYTIRQHLKSPGSTFMKRVPKGQSYGGRPIWWHWKGPFVEPAMKSFVPKIPNLLNKFVDEAIRGAK